MREFNRFHARVDFQTGCYVNIYEGARRTRTVTNDGDDGNPAPQFLVSKTYLGGKKNGFFTGEKKVDLKT